VSEKDALFTGPERPGPFVWDHDVARVFPDMLERSIPGYRALLEQIGALSARLVSSESRVYDLGCSLGAATFAVLGATAGREPRTIAVDSSPAMIERFGQALGALSAHVELRLEDVTDTPIDSATLVILNFTLQFVPRAERAPLSARIFSGLLPGGVLVLSEKTRGLGADEELLAGLHDEFRRHRGYSDVELNRKRKALEQVLLPDTSAEHVARLQQAGFHVVEWFRALGFVSWLAIKPR